KINKISALFIFAMALSVLYKV
ncbi:LysE family translocator, partial [Campylobacter coli]|nr:LysE family translocator [Campylobacter coli]